MSRFNPTDKLASASSALHLHWRPAQWQTPGSPASPSKTQLILAAASGTEGLESRAADTPSIGGYLYKKGISLSKL